MNSFIDKSLKIFNSNKIFWYSSALVIVIFLTTRLPYYLYYSITGISSDSASYCAVAINILELKIPIFEVRTPGYPFFLSLIWFFSKNFFYVCLIQSIITLITSIFFLWVINKTYKSITFLFAISLSAFISSSPFLILEATLLTEGIFINFLILSIALLILSLKRNKYWLWILFSISLALIIIVRPVGLFLIFTIILLLIFFAVNRYKLKFYVSLAIPFTVIILSLCTYNYFTLRAFTLTPFGESNLSGVTILFMEPSPEYPPHVNDAINNILNSIPRKHKSYVKEGYEMKKLYRIFLENYARVTTLVGNLMKRDSTLTYTKIQPVIRRIYIDAIKKYPEVYAKFFLCNFYQFFMNIRSTIGFHNELAKNYNKTILEKIYVKELEEDEWKQVSSSIADHEKVKNLYQENIVLQSNFNYIIKTDSNQVELKPTFLGNVYETYEKVYNFLFRNIIWLILFGITFLLSIYKFVKNRFKDIDSFIFFLIGMMFLTKALLVSLVEISLLRYSYPVEFAIFFSLPFFILLIKKPKNNSQIKNQ